MPESENLGRIFDIQRYSINDGPGIRTTIFFKGCPLSCLWCDNPESQSPFPQLLFYPSLCARCYQCAAVCPTQATTVGGDGAIQIDRDKCISCGKCTTVCSAEARVISGKLMKVEDVIEIVKKDSLFYRNSGGGVTASGGEPTSQPQFLKELLIRCHQCGFHTAMETCGYVPWETLEGFLEHVDLFLYDIKHMNPHRHKELTGVDNTLILENARRLAAKKKQLIIRFPLIPGYNDSIENLEATKRFVYELGVEKLDLVPYHQLGISKYQRLGWDYQLIQVLSYKEEDVEAIRKRLEAYNFTVSIA